MNNRVFTGVACVGLGLSATLTAAAQTANNSATLEEVVVTAQKRVENVQKTAIAISTVQREEIEKRGINSLDQALHTVAGVRLQSTAQGGAAIFIRGVGNNEVDSSLSYQPAIAINVDGVTNTQAGDVLSSMLDVERVEVLRGPQGTLYGASAEGGVVNVVLAQPSNKFEARGRLQVGNYNARQMEGVLNVPLGDMLALRFTASNNEHDGYINGPKVYLGTCPPNPMGPPSTGVCYPAPNDSIAIPYVGSNLGAADATSYRVKAKFDPTEWLSMTGTYEHQRNKGTNSSTISLADLRANKWYANAAQIPNGSKADVYSANVVLQFGSFGELTLLPASRTTITDVNPLAAVLGMGPAAPAKLTQETYEARLSSLADSKTTWVLGGYYSKAATNLAASATPTTASAANPGAVSPTNPYGYTGYGVLGLNRPFDNWNIFGQATYPITDTFRVTAGARYTHTKTGYSYLLYQARYPAGSSILTVDSAATYEQITPVNNTTYKAGIEYDFAPDSMFYAQVSTGFKAGGLGLAPDAMGMGVINGPQDVQLQAYKAEDLMTFEVGSKNRFLDNRLQLNGAVHYSKWKNMQLQEWLCLDSAGNPYPPPLPCVGGGPPGPGQVGFTQKVFNAGTSTQYGLEGDLTWLMTANDKVNLNLSMLHGRYGRLEFPNQDTGLLNVLTDREMSNSPALTGNLGYEHNFKLGTVTLTPRIDEQFTTHYYNTQEFWFDGSLVPGFHKTDASITLAGDKWSVNLFARNIWNKATAQFTLPGPTGSAVLVSDPRIVGIGVTGSF